MSHSAAVFGGEPKAASDGFGDRREIIVEAAAGEWVEYDRGSYYKTLFSDETNGIKVALYKMEKGVQGAPHNHSDCIEQVFVVSGRMNIGHATLTAGDFLIRQPLVDHQSVAEEETILYAVFSLPRDKL